MYIYTYYHVIIVIPKYIYIYIYIRSYQLVIITTILCCFIVMIVIHIDLFVLWLLQWFPYTHIYIYQHIISTNSELMEKNIDVDEQCSNPLVVYVSFLTEDQKLALF